MQRCATQHCSSNCHMAKVEVRAKFRATDTVTVFGTAKPCNL
jgi:hypothetical protein